MSGQTTGATVDTLAVNNGRLIVDTDTKFCSGHTTTGSASNGSLDTVTIASTAIDGELKLDGTNVWIIPIRSGSGTAPVPIATSLVPTAASWSAGVATITVTHSYAVGDMVGVGGFVGAEEVNGYCGTFIITAISTTVSFSYALPIDPGVGTITNGKVVKYYKCSQTQTKTPTTGTAWAAGTVTFTTTAAHNIIAGNSVVVTGVTPSGYNGTYTVLTAPTTTTFTAALVADPGAWSSGGTITKTVDSAYLGAWSSFTAGPTAATMPAAGWLKVKNLTNAPFEAGVALTIQGGTSPAATVVSAEHRGWIEVVGAELSTTPAVYTIPRLGKFTVTGDWFYPLTAVPFTLASGCSWSGNVTSYTTSAAHGIAVGSQVHIVGTNPVGYDGIYTVVTVPTTTTFTVAQVTNPGAWSAGGWGHAELRTNGVAQQTIQLPASGGTTVGTTSYAGVWVETAVDAGTYEFYPCVGNATATAAMFMTEAARGKVCYMGAAGLLRFGGDGTNAWGYLPPSGLRIRVPNVISVNATKIASFGVYTQGVPNATLTSRPKFVTTSAGVVSIDKWQSSWYPIFQQPYSVNISNMAQCEMMLVSEIAQQLTWSEVHTGMSVVASSAQLNALSISTCYAGGTITNCSFDKFHAGTASYYSMLATDLQGFTFTNCRFGILMTTAVGGATARRTTVNTHGVMSLIRVADSTFTNTTLIGDNSLLTTCTNLSFTTNHYTDSLQGATTSTSPQSIFTFVTNSSTITVNGIDFNGLINVHPYTALVDVLSASNNLKIRNVGTATAPLSLGSTAATGVLWLGATGGAGYNIEFKRIYCTLARTGLVATADNSYNNITYESCWLGNGLTFTNTQLNVKSKGLAVTNAVAGQTSVYGASWQDYLTPVGGTLAAGTAWASNVTTYTTGAAHNLVAGDVVTISGVVASVYNMTGGYNGTYTVLASGLTSTVFKVDQLTNPGTWTSGGTTNPLLGKLVLQMNEQTVATPSYTFNKTGAGSGFTSVGTLVLLNLDDTITWETPYYVLGHQRFSNGGATPWVVAQPTFTSTNPNNHNWYYDIDKGSGYVGTFKNLHFKGARGAASWAITGTTTVTLTPTTASVTASIADDIMTVTAVASGYLYEGMTCTGTGVTAGTVITEVIDSTTGKAGSYRVGIMTVSGGTYSIGASIQTVASTTVTASTSVYGIAVGDNVFDLTTAGNVATNAKVASISSLTVFVLDLASTNSTSQVMAFSAIHSEASIVAATGFKLKVKCRVNTVSTTNSLTTVAIPTVTNSTYQQVQYPLDMVSVTFNKMKDNSEVRIYATGTSTEIAGIENATAGTTDNRSYTWTAEANSVVDYVIHNFLSAATIYKSVRVNAYTVPTSATSVDIQQQLDRNCT